MPEVLLFLLGFALGCAFFARIQAKRDRRVNMIIVKGTPEQKAEVKRQIANLSLGYHVLADGIWIAATRNHRASALRDHFSQTLKVEVAVLELTGMWAGHKMGDLCAWLISAKDQFD